jgi:hypothetical protein
MDQRYLRLTYELIVSKSECSGPYYFEPWHQWASYRKQREDKFKNIDRTTIRKGLSDGEPSRFLARARRRGARVSPGRRGCAPAASR